MRSQIYYKFGIRYLTLSEKVPSISTPTVPTTARVRTEITNDLICIQGDKVRESKHCFTQWFCQRKFITYLLRALMFDFNFSKAPIFSARYHVFRPEYHKLPY